MTNAKLIPNNEGSLLRRSAYALPEGFAVSPARNNAVVWATGYRYTADGTNPDRVQTLWLFRDALCVDWDTPAALRPATVDQARAWCQALREAMDRNKAKARAACEADCGAFESQARSYERQLESMLADKP